MSTKSITRMKSLGDLKTTISTHARSTPREEGETFLEVYLLDKERQRLETEVAMHFKRTDRIQIRLAEIARVMAVLLEKSRQEKAALAERDSQAGGRGGPPSRPAAGRPEWKKLTIGY